MNEALYFMGSDGRYWVFTVNSYNQWQQTGSIDEGELPSGATVVDKSPSGSVLNEGNSFAELSGTASTTDPTETTEPPDPVDPTGGTEWGAANITRDMFVNPDGTQRTVQEVYAELDPILTGITGESLVNYINDIFPKYTGVPEEEKGFLEKEKGFTERGLELKKEADIYGLQPKTGGAITPTTGAGMRASIGTQADIKKGFGAAYGTYGLGMEKAAFTEEKGLYGLEKDVAGAYEADVLGAIGGMPEGTFAEPGADALTSSWDVSWMGREGGRVPSKSETFLDFLTKLPDAGGM